LQNREELNVKTRDIIRKKVRFLRRQGITPANLYGPAIESMPLQAETVLLRRLIAKVGLNALIALKVDGSAPRLAMIREIQRNPITGELLHVDFFQVEMTHKVRVEVPLAFVGEAPAAKRANAMLIQSLNSLHVEALPADLPRSLEVDLSVLKEIGQSISVKDILRSDRIEILNDPHLVVAQVSEVRAPVEEEVVKVKAEAEAEGEAPAEAPEEAETKG